MTRRASNGDGERLWRCAHASDVSGLRRAAAHLLWSYRAAPIRRLLAGPDALDLFDGFLVAMVTAMVLPRPDRAEAATGPEPLDSGWRGNMVAVTGWLAGLAVIWAMIRLLA